MMGDAKVTCDDCGLCCLNQPIPPFVPGDPTGDVIRLTILESPRFDDSYPCAWLNMLDGTCRHYHDRPAICREFEVGGEACLEMRKAAGL